MRLLVMFSTPVTVGKNRNFTLFPWIKTIKSENIGTQYQCYTNYIIIICVKFYKMTLPQEKNDAYKK